MSDGCAAQEQVQEGKRVSKSRMSTVSVSGVGKVQVLNENDCSMREDVTF